MENQNDMNGWFGCFLGRSCFTHEGGCLVYIVNGKGKNKPKSSHSVDRVCHTLGELFFTKLPSRLCKSVQVQQ